jgi:hypothetical protein
MEKDRRDVNCESLAAALMVAKYPETLTPTVKFHCPSVNSQRSLAGAGVVDQIVRAAERVHRCLDDLVRPAEGGRRGARSGRPSRPGDLSHDRGGVSAGPQAGVVHRDQRALPGQEEACSRPMPAPVTIATLPPSLPTSRPPKGCEMLAACANRAGSVAG